MRLFSLVPPALLNWLGGSPVAYVCLLLAFHGFTCSRAHWPVLSFRFRGVAFSLLFFPFFSSFFLFYHLPESSSFFFFGLLAGVVRRPLRFLRCFVEISAAAATFQKAGDPCCSPSLPENLSLLLRRAIFWAAAVCPWFERRCSLPPLLLCLPRCRWSCQR